MRKKRIKTFNQGLLEHGEFETVRDSKNKVTGKDFKKDGELYFNYVNTRMGDTEQYGGSRNVVDEKLETHYNKESLNAIKVRIEGVEYDVNAIDPSNDRKSMYWYLAKVGEAQNV